jgi:hypothetical protein
VQSGIRAAGGQAHLAVTRAEVTKKLEAFCDRLFAAAHESDSHLHLGESCRAWRKELYCLEDMAAPFSDHHEVSYSLREAQECLAVTEEAAEPSHEDAEWAEDSEANSQLRRGDWSFFLAATDLCELLVVNRGMYDVAIEHVLHCSM